MFAKMGNVLIPPAGGAKPQAKEESLTPQEKNSVQTWTSYVPTLGWCQDQSFRNLSNELAKKAFVTSTAYGIWSSPKKLKESLCGKKACGAVQAFTTVPPMGMVDEKATTTGHKTNDAFNACGNVEITWQFFPTANSYLAGIWGKPKNQDILSKFLVFWKWFETTIEVDAGVSPKIMSKAGEVTKYTELAAADDFTGTFLFWRTGTATFPSSGNAMLPEIWGNWSDSFTFGDNNYKKMGRFVFQSLPFGQNLKSIGNIFASIFGFDTEGWSENPDFAITSFLAKTKNMSGLKSFAKVTTPLNQAAFDTHNHILSATNAIPAPTEVAISSSLIDSDITFQNITFPSNPQYQNEAPLSLNMPGKWRPKPLNQSWRKPPFKPGDKVIFEAVYEGSTGTTWVEGTVGTVHQKPSTDIKWQGTLSGKEYYNMKVKVTAVSGSGLYKDFALKLPSSSAKSALTTINTSTMAKVNHLKMAYWQERMKKLGWGPYRHEFVKGESDNHPHLEQGTLVGHEGFFDDDTWQSIDKSTDRRGMRLNAEGIAMYHNRHIVKIIQGFINDLKSVEESEANVHPSRKHNTQTVNEHTINLAALKSIQHNMAGTVSQSPYNSFSDKAACATPE